MNITNEIWAYPVTRNIFKNIDFLEPYLQKGVRDTWHIMTDTACQEKFNYSYTYNMHAHMTYEPRQLNKYCCLSLKKKTFFVFFLSFIYVKNFCTGLYVLINSVYVSVSYSTCCICALFTKLSADNLL